MTDDAKRREAQEGFGEATPGEGQSQNPPPDPEMIEEVPVPEDEEPSPEEAAGDEDAGPAHSPEQAELDESRDQAEG